MSRHRIVAVAAVVGCLPTITHAQTASQITPPSFTPPREDRPGAPIDLPSNVARQAPAGAEQLFVTLAGVETSGGSLSADTLAALRAQVVGKRVSVADLYAAAAAAETAEARAGRVLLRVAVPQQQLTDGATLRLTVVEGFIERVDTAALPGAVRARVSLLAARLLLDKDVTQADLERRLLLAADVPGVTLRSTLAPGERPGGVVLRIDADYRPVTGFLSVDNTLPEALGRTAYGIGVDFNSVLGAGELIYLRASGLPNTGPRTSFLDPTPRNRALAAGMVLPLGSDGLTLTIEGTDARTAPRRASALLPGFGSRFQRLSYALRYPVVRRRALTVGLEAGFDAQDERVRLIDPVVLPISQDRLRILRAAGDVSAYLPGGGYAAARVEGSFGIDALGARSARDASVVLPLSRAGSDADFQKLTLTASLDQPVADHLSLAARARAQTGFGQVMANAEQIGIASTDALSPLPSGLIQGDDGYAIRGEGRAPFAITRPGVFASLSPYAFAAHGAVRFQQPTAFERRTTEAFAYGAGVRLAGQARGGTPGLSAGVEYGRAHLEGLRPDRVTFNILARF